MMRFHLFLEKNRYTAKRTVIPEAHMNSTSACGMARSVDALQALFEDV